MKVRFEIELSEKQEVRDAGNLVIGCTWDADKDSPEMKIFDQFEAGVFTDELALDYPGIGEMLDRHLESIEAEIICLGNIKANPLVAVQNPDVILKSGPVLVLKFDTDFVPRS